MWAKDEECQRIVTEGWKWGSISSFTTLANTVERCGYHLAKWNKEVFGNLQVRIR